MVSLNTYTKLNNNDTHTKNQFNTHFRSILDDTDLSIDGTIKDASRKFIWFEIPWQYIGYRINSIEEQETEETTM